jgi:DNA-binding NtrC family response regulator
VRLPRCDRPEDVQLLADHFSRKSAKPKSSRSGFPVTYSAMAARLAGNVRELRNVVQRAFVMSDSTSRCVARTRSLEGIAQRRAATLAIRVGTSIADAERALISQRWTTSTARRNAPRPRSASA